MKRPLLLKALLLFGLFWISGNSFAQTPEPDLDSITEDSYRRMLERREIQKESDSLMKSQTLPLIQEQKTEDYLLWPYLVGVLTIVGLLAWLGQKSKRLKS